MNETTSQAYAGIGSRETPRTILNLMHQAARELRTAGFTLRSGHAEGADSAFEAGHDSLETTAVPSLKEIYLPWQGFANSNSPLYIPQRNVGAISPEQANKAYQLASTVHPAWNRMAPKDPARDPHSPAQRLHARNGFQMLGLNLDCPVRFVLCYTHGGKGEGGTGQALRIAHQHDIPVFDFGTWKEPITRVTAYLRTFLEIHTRF